MNALQPYLIWIKLIACLAIAAAIFGAGVYVTADHYQAIIAENKANYETAYNAAVKAQLAEAAAHQTDLINAENDHAKNQLAINNLSTQLNSMRIHIPSLCTGTGSQTSAASESANGASGVLPNPVDDAFARLQEGVGKLVQRCDQLNIDAIQLNDSLAK